MQPIKGKSMKQESQTISSNTITPVTQNRTRGSKFLFQELFKKQEEERLKSLNKENADSRFENASSQANKYVNHEQGEEHSPKCVSAPSNICGKTPKGLALIKVRSGQVKIRPPINAADISFEGEKVASKFEKENTKRKKITKNHNKDNKEKEESINSPEIIKESKDRKGKNKSKKFNSHTKVLQNSNSSNSSLETVENINKTHDVYFPVDELSLIGTSTQEIFQNKEYKGNNSPKNSPSKDLENLNKLQNLINDDTNIFKIFTPSSSPETVEISSDSENEPDNGNEEKGKVLIEETVIQPVILAEDSFQNTNKNDTSDSFDSVHKGVMTQITANESPIIGIKKTKRKKNITEDMSGTSKKPKKTYLMNKIKEKCDSIDKTSVCDQENEEVSNNHTNHTIEISEIDYIEKEVTGNVEESLKVNDDRKLTKKNSRSLIDKRGKSELVTTPKYGSSRNFPEISPCSDGETTPFLSNPNDVLQTPRSKSLFTKLSLSQKKKIRANKESLNSEIDSSPKRILKKNMKSNLKKVTSNTRKCTLTEFEDMTSSFIMSSDSNTSDSASSVVESSSSSFVDRTVGNPETVNVANTDTHGRHSPAMSHEIFDPEFRSSIHLSTIKRKIDETQDGDKLESDSVLQTESIPPDIEKNQETEVITIKSSSETSSNNSMATNLKLVLTEKASSSEGSNLSYASSDSTEMLKPVGRSCLSGVTMVLEQFFGASLEDCLKILQKNSFNILTTIQELQELYPDAAEIMGEDTIYSTFNDG